MLLSGAGAAEGALPHLIMPVIEMISLPEKENP